MTVVVVSALCVINIFLWFLFFKKFTRLFSTNDIIENTRAELNKLIIDVNRNAERNITLLEDRIKVLKEIIAEADKHIAIAKSESEKKTMESLYRQTVEQTAAGSSSQVNRAVKEYRRNAIISAPEKMEKNGQVDLFDGQIPTSVSGPPVYASDAPVIIKKDFNVQVQERYERGESVEDIAAALSRSITEVQFALDMNE